MQLSPLLQNHAVVQRRQPLRLWGWDVPWQQLSLKIAGDHFRVVVGSDGRWEIETPEPPEEGAFEIVVEGSTTRILRDVVAGEVWICSGQSNMTMSLANSAEGVAAVHGANCPALRLFHVPTDVSIEPQNHCGGQWELCCPESASGFSAVAYYFGRKLCEALQVPVGLIHASWGNTPIHSWMDREALESKPALRPILTRWESLLETVPEAKRDLKACHRRWKEAMTLASPSRAEWLRQATLDKMNGRIPLPEPPRPNGPGDNQSPTIAFNAMVAPLAPWKVRGVLWYQGETDAIQGRAAAYPALFAAMAGCWRHRWKNPSLPFLTAQIANYCDPQTEDAANRWAELRWAQSEAAKNDPNTSMIVTTDFGESTDIHPKNKRGVGERFCHAALTEVYRHPAPYQGPQVVNTTLSARGASVEFDSELYPQGFLPVGAGVQLSTEVGAFFPASAMVEGRKLRMDSPDSTSPKAVRYGWTDDAPSIIRNSAGIPAAPFRTDAWPLTTEGII